MNGRGIILPPADSRIFLQSALLAVRNCRVSILSAKILSIKTLFWGISLNVNKCWKEGAFYWVRRTGTHLGISTSYLFTKYLHILQKIHPYGNILTNIDGLLFSWMYSPDISKHIYQIIPWYSWDTGLLIKRKNDWGCVYWKVNKLPFHGSCWDLGS